MHRLQNFRRNQRKAVGQLMDVIEAIQQRASIRAYLDKPVAQDIIHNILEVARWAPSGTNTQPWHVAVVTGDSKQKLSASIIEKFASQTPSNADYHYYPAQWREPYKSRRFQCGLALYQALGIAREDKVKRREQWALNYRFFDAPVGMVFYIDAQLRKGSWMDMGMFIQNVMLAARGFGLDTCAQASIAEYPDVVREVLNISNQFHIVCGMSLGYADYEQAVNRYRTQREPVEAFTQWYD
jgi:nitroreductase